jgi:hypothetical protein
MGFTTIRINMKNNDIKEYIYFRSTTKCIGVSHTTLE